MFSTLKQKLLLGIYIFILLSIPVAAYLVSRYQTTIKTSASEQKNTKPTTKTSSKGVSSPAKEILNASQQAANSSSETSGDSSSPTIATSYGPTLSLQATLEGRIQTNFATKMFVGIADGNLTTNPKFLLSFSINLPASGQYSNLSLAGLNPGSRYTALLKGSAQIATSAAFIMSPTVTNLNDGQPVNLISGDLNDDNVINSADYSIAQKALGATTKNANWNENADFNKDGIVNTLDLAIISKNIGQVGASGAWISPVPKAASPSAALTTPPIGSPAGGYWLWVPD